MHSAQRKVNDLQTHLKVLDSKVAEKEAEIRILQEKKSKIFFVTRNSLLNFLFRIFSLQSADRHSIRTTVSAWIHWATILRHRLTLPTPRSTQRRTHPFWTKHSAEIQRISIRIKVHTWDLVTVNQRRHTIKVPLICRRLPCPETIHQILTT